MDTDSIYIDLFEGLQKEFAEDNEWKVLVQYLYTPDYSLSSQQI